MRSSSINRFSHRPLMPARPPHCRAGRTGAMARARPPGAAGELPLPPACPAHCQEAAVTWGRRGGGGGGVRRHASLLLQAPGAPRLGPFPEAFPVPFANLHLLNQRRKGRWLCSEGTVSFHGCISSDHDRDLGRRGQGCGWGALKVGCPPAEPAGPVRRK